MTFGRRSTAKALVQNASINQERSYGHRKRSETFVIHKVNYAVQGGVSPYDVLSPLCEVVFSSSWASIIFYNGVVEIVA